MWPSSTRISVTVMFLHISFSQFRFSIQHDQDIPGCCWYLPIANDLPKLQAVVMPKLSEEFTGWGLRNPAVGHTFPSHHPSYASCSCCGRRRLWTKAIFWYGLVAVLRFSGFSGWRKSLSSLWIVAGWQWRMHWQSSLVPKPVQDWEQRLYMSFAPWLRYYVAYLAVWSSYDSSRVRYEDLVIKMLGREESLAYELYV